MKRQKVIAMLLAGTLALSQPLTAFASDEGLVSDSTDENTVSEQIDAESESEGLIEDESSSEDMEQNSVEVSNEASLDTTEANDQSLSTDAFDDGSDEQIASDESNDADALTVAKNPSCQVTMSNGSKIDMEISNSGGEIPSDYNLDVRETVGDQKKNIEDEVNSAYGDKSKQNKKKEASAMFDLKVKDAQDNDIAFSDPSIITMSSTDFSFLNDSVLYHKKEDGSWEQLEYKQSSDGEKNVQYITFTVDDAYGTFVFSKEVENSKNDNKETDITNDEISDASEPEDSSEDLSVVKQINNFSWNGGILGHDMTIKVSSEASYPETSTLQVAEIPDDKIKAGIDAITKETGKKVAANSAVSINICKANGDVDSANGTYHINFAGVTVTDDTLLYHELNDNKWEAVSYQKSNSGVEFSSSNGLGNFVFLEPEKEESKEDRKDDTDKANTESNKTYSYEDDDVTITATANKDAGIPDGAELYAERLPEGTDAYNAAMSEIEDSVKVKDGQKLLYIPYDVYFVSNGKKIEPKSGKVEVKMEFKNALFGTSPKQDEAFIAHIKNDGTVEQIANSSKEKDTVEFDVDSFSIVGPAMVTEADEKDTASV